MTAKNPFRVLVNTPAELATQFAENYKKRQKDPGITWGIPDIDKRVIPMKGGDLVGLVARPGHAKSSLLAYLAKREGREIMKRGMADKQCVVYVTWESSAEEIENFFLGGGDWSASDVAWGRVAVEDIMKKVVKRASFPVWTIGHSLARAGKPMPRMTLPAVLKAIETMEADYGIKPTLMLFDYLQLIPVDGANDRKNQVLEAPPLIKELAERIGVPAVCGIQAARDVDNRDYKMPQKHDCQWSSSIEQAADKLFGLWRPILTEKEGAEPIQITYKDGDFISCPITENLLLMQMLKQRGDSGRYTWALHFQPQYLRLAEVERMKASEYGHDSYTGGK